MARNASLLVAATVISVLGTEFSNVAIPLLVLGNMHGSPFELGVVNAMEFLPFAIVALYAGVYVDRSERKRILLTADISRATLMFVIAVFVSSQVLGIWALYALTLAISVLTVFFDVASQAWLPRIVAEGTVVKANSVIEAGRAIATVVGPALAGVLIAHLGAGPTIAFDGLSFALSALLIRLIFVRSTAPLRASLTMDKQNSYMSDLMVGFRLIGQERPLVQIILATAIVNCASAFMLPLFFVFVTSDLLFSSTVVGALYAAGGMGSLVAAFIAPKIGRRFTLRTSLISAIFASQLAWFVLPLVASHKVELPEAVLIVTSFIVRYGAITVFNIQQISFRQSQFPAELLGRVGATVKFIVWGVMPIGAILGGLSGEWIGARNSLYVGAFCGLCAVFPLASISLTKPWRGE